jgi:hypothetical protein
MTVRGGGKPCHAMAFVPSLRMGPPPRSLAADAHACIMVRVTATHRIQGCGASPSRLDSELPSNASSRPQQACRRARGCHGSAMERRPKGATTGLDSPLRASTSNMCGSRQRNGIPSRTKKLGRDEESEQGRQIMLDFEGLIQGVAWQQARERQDKRDDQP